MDKEQAIKFGLEFLELNKFSKGTNLYQFVSFVVKALQAQADQIPCEDCQTMSADNCQECKDLKWKMENCCCVGWKE